MQVGLFPGNVSCLWNPLLQGPFWSISPQDTLTPEMSHPGIYQSSSWRSLYKDSLCIQVPTSNMSYLTTPTAAGPSPQAQSRGYQGKVSLSAWWPVFVLYSLHTTVLSVWQICHATLGLEYHHVWGLYCHECCCSVTSDVLPCKMLIPLVTTNIIHKRPLWHEIACVHLSLWALLSSASSLQGRLQPNQYLWFPQPKSDSLQLLLEGMKAA